MTAQVARLAAAVAFITLCMLLPFLPGRYDSLAATLSLMAQVFGKIGLLLPPLGLLWMVCQQSPRRVRLQNAAAAVALITTWAVLMLVSAVALVESPIFGQLCLGLGVMLLLKKIVPQLKMLGRANTGPASRLPAYLIVVPAAVALLQLALAGPAIEFARSRAIRNSGPLIADIEAHRAANGRYPTSLVSVWVDYHPAVIGIKEYRYEPSGDAYNLLFELPTLQLGLREMVVYNPRDQQAIASHAMDVLQLSPAALALDRTRGHNAVYDAGPTHWKYFWFD